jgi:hypothetical protein
MYAVPPPQQGGHPALPGHVGERGEPPFEVGPRCPLAGRETGRDLAHREQSHRRRLARREHGRGQRSDLPDLNFCVL